LSEVINIGLDFGSLGCRLACSKDNEISSLPLPTGWTGPARWLFCEPAPASMLGVQFSTIKSRLESTKPGESMNNIAATLHGRMLELHDHLQTSTGCSVGQLVIAVPAHYPGFQREELTRLAMRAGFANVHLLNDSMAAVIAHTHHRDVASTMLVYSMGYAGFEIGLIRVAKKRLQTLSYAGGSSPSGAVFDAGIIRGCLHAFKKARLWSPSQNLSAEGWLALRNWAEQLKQGVSLQNEFWHRLTVEELGWWFIPIGMPRSAFEHSIASSIKSTLDATDRMLQEGNLIASDVDEVLLIGGTTRIPYVQQMLAERFARPIINLGDFTTAQGAVIYSAQLGTHSGLPFKPEIEGLKLAGQADVDSPPVPTLKISLHEEKGNTSTEAETPKTTESTSQNTSVIKISSPSVKDSRDNWSREAGNERSAEKISSSMEAGLTYRQNLFEYAKQLIEQGHHERALGFLLSIIQEARSLSVSISSRRSSIMNLEVQHILRSSYESLLEGKYEQAIQQSHKAHEMDSETPEVFQQMIDIHCEAAMSNNSIAGYSKSIEWLMCAYHFDRSNHIIHNRIAERHFLHAQQTSEQSRQAEALRALEECLYFNPDHEAAVKLQLALTNTI
jgi:tetratricopeptide (TPR) repeat protein